MIEVNNIDEYIANFPTDVQEILQEIRTTIAKALPKATEVISYKMPAFKQHKVLIYFAAYKNHIGLYPTSSGIKAFEKDFANYKWSKGAVQFPINEKMPLKLIEKIARFRAKEDAEKDTKKVK